MKRPTQGALAKSSKKFMCMAEALERIVARSVNGVPAEDDRAALVAIARQLPKSNHAALRPVFAELGIEL